jgi:hypothetical protein
MKEEKSETARREGRREGGRERKKERMQSTSTSNFLSLLCHAAAPLYEQGSKTLQGSFVFGMVVVLFVRSAAAKD